jgi:hypothetical protein
LAPKLGVLLGRILLVVELEQNRDRVRAQILHELTMGIIDSLQMPANTEQLAENDRGVATLHHTRTIGLLLASTIAGISKNNDVAIKLGAVANVLE